MSSDMSIKEFLESNETGRIALRGKIVSGFEDGRFHLADQSGHVQVRGKSVTKFLSQISMGKFVKIINPELDSNLKNCILIGDKSMIIPTRRIKELEDFELNSDNAGDCNSLEMAAKLEPKQVRSSNFQTLKIVFFSR